MPCGIRQGREPIIWGVDERTANRCMRHTIQDRPADGVAFRLRRRVTARVQGAGVTAATKKDYPERKRGKWSKGGHILRAPSQP